MSRTLQPPDNRVRIISPTTFRKLAQRMLVASREVTRMLPNSFSVPGAVELLLEAYVAADADLHPEIHEIASRYNSDVVRLSRWANALRSEGLLVSLGPLRLTAHGHRHVESLIEAVYNAQRELD